MRILILLSVLTLIACSSDSDYNKTFYKDGELKSIGKYDNNTGHRKGRWKFYFSDGQLESNGKFVNGEKEGEWKVHARNGSNYYRLHEYKNGELQ